MARLYISEREMGETVVLDLNGDITFGEGNTLLRAAIRRLLGAGRNRICLNFAGAGYLDSSGVGELVSGYMAVKRAGGKLTLLNLPPRIQQLLTITRLLTIFEVAESTAEASGALEIK